MAIAPVSSVSYKSTQNYVNFEGRKDKENRGHRGISNTIKAIPLATLIALSPLNTVDAQNMRINNGNYELTEMPNGEQWAVFEQQRGIDFGEGLNCNLTCVLEPDGDTMVDRLTLTYTQPALRSPGAGKRGVMGSSVDVNAIKVVNVTEDNQNGVINKYKEYYVVGNLRRTNSVYDKATGERLERKVIKRENFSERISPELYKKIKSMMGDNIEQKVENVTRDTSNSYYGF